MSWLIFPYSLRLLSWLWCSCLPAKCQWSNPWNIWTKSTCTPNQDNTWTVCYILVVPWWRHQMETFSALLAICAGNSPVPGEFPAQRPVTQSFDVFFDLRLNKRLSKQSWRWWFETPSGPLWRRSNALYPDGHMTQWRVIITSKRCRFDIIMTLWLRRMATGYVSRGL